MADNPESFLKKFWELLFQNGHSLFDSVGEGLSWNADLLGNSGVTQALFTQSADFDSLGHDFTQAVEDLSHVNGVGHIVRRRRGLQIRHLFLQMVKPVHLLAFIIRTATVQGTHVTGGVARAVEAIHIAEKTLGGRAYAAPVVLLGAAVCVDVAVVIIKLLLGARDALLGSAEIDVVLVVIGFHVFGSFQISQSVQSR